MSNVSASFTNVYVSGTLNSWSGNANQLTDPDGDGVYEADISLAAGNYEFKFTYDNWVGQESLDATLDSACTLTTGAFTNRYITIGASDTSQYSVGKSVLLVLRRRRVVLNCSSANTQKALLTINTLRSTTQRQMLFH